MTHPSLILYYFFFFVLLYHTSAQANQCYPPELDNGVVESNGGDFFLTAGFQCNDGYSLSGPSLLKCRNGIWSGVTPVCSVSGCDPNKLPTFDNGRRLRVKGTRNSVFKYKCNRGYRLLGPKNVYCTVEGWKSDELPVCARPGCDESSLLGGGTPHGHHRSLLQGAVVRFYCESGAMMSGNSAVYCDGYSWNGTKPECLVPPTPPVLSLKVDGEETSSAVVSVGQQLNLVCTAMGGNPAPDLSFMLNGEHVEADKIEDDAVYTITVEETHNNLDMSCIAQNRLSSIPVASNHQRLRVRFGPNSTYIHGPEILIPGTDADYSCTSAESDPAADISVQVSDQDGNIIAVELTKLPKMKGSAGFASALQFKFPVLSHYKSVLMKCEADNGVGRAVSQHAVNSMYPPSNIDITQSDTTDDQEDMLRCVTDQSNPAPTITWVVETADKTDNIPEDLTTVETINEGTGWRKISTLLLGPNKNEMMKVHCIATIESLGFTKMSDMLEIHPTDISVHLLGLTEGSEVIEESPLDLTCTVAAMQGLRSIQWWVDGKLKNEGDMAGDDKGNMVSTFRWRPDMGDTRIECRAEVEGNTVSHGVSLVVLEDPDYGYGEDFWLALLDEEENKAREEETLQSVEKEEYNQDYDPEEKDDYREEEISGELAQEEEKDYIYEEENYDYGLNHDKHNYDYDLNQDKDNYDYDLNQDKDNYDYGLNQDKDNVSRSIKISHNGDLNEEDTAIHPDKKPVSVDLIDATKQETTFAASEPESAVLSHKSDSTKPISADILSPKSMFSSSFRIRLSNIFSYLFAISCICRFINY